MPAQSNTQWLPQATSTGSAGTGSYAPAPSLSGTSYPGVFGGGVLGDTLTALYGAKPGTANPVSTAHDAIVGNLWNLPAIGKLTLGADAISAAGARLPFEMNLPYYDEMMGTASGNVLSQLQGELPPDVQNMIAQRAAERRVGSGAGFDSPSSTADYLRALGLTSLDLENQGLGGLARLMGITPTGESYNPSKMFVSPAAQQAAQQAANEMAAAPDPGLSGLLDTFMP